MSNIFPDEHRRIIAGRAMTLFERLDEPDALIEGGRPEAGVKETFETWKGLYPTESAFQRRLERDGLTENAGKQAISATRLAPDEPIPDWINALEALVAAVGRFGGESTLPDDTPVHHERPFGPLSAAIAHHARTQLDWNFEEEVAEKGIQEEVAEKDLEVKVAEGALDPMVAWFRLLFERRYLRLLSAEFKTFVAVHDPALAEATPSSFENPPTELYEQFIAYLLDGGFADFCEAYPCFARQLVRQVRDWCAHLWTCYTRLTADQKRIARCFDIDGDLGAVTAIEPVVGTELFVEGHPDLRVTFECGHSIVYKSRAVEIDETFARVLDRLDDHLPVPELAAPVVLSGDGYGWVEWTEYEPCADDADGGAVERFYQRLGALACLGYLLDAREWTLERLVVAGEHPILTDAETLAGPYFSIESRPWPDSEYNTLTDESVLCTRLFPYEIDGDGEPLETNWQADAGINITGASEVVPWHTTPTVTASNSDVMTVEPSPKRIDRSENVPSVAGRQYPPESFVDAVRTGFKETYKAIIDLRDEGRLASEIGIPDAFESLPGRTSYRSPRAYVPIIQSLQSPACLADGTRFGIELDRLAVPFCDGRVADAANWSILEAERDAVGRFERPRFTSRVGDRRLFADGESLGVRADSTGLERSRRRIAAASRADLLDQLELLSLALGSPRESAPETTGSCASNGLKADTDALSDDLRARAYALLDEIIGGMIQSTDGVYYWEGVASSMPGEPPKLRGNGYSLYNGRVGIALLGATAHRLTGESRYRHFALGILDPVCNAVETGRPVAALGRHGGCVGLGSTTYGLAVAAELLDEEELYATLERIPPIATPEFVRSDRAYDVVGGAAGTLLGFLGAYERCGEEAFLATAHECGEHLLQTGTRTDEGHLVWTGGDVPALAGFSHGASGIAYALSRLSSAVDDLSETDTLSSEIDTLSSGIDSGRFREAAIDALGYESTLYSETERNWPDLRADAGGYTDMWCHGRTGICLARVGMAAHIPHPLVERGIEAGVKGIEVDPREQVDHLCCGSAGKATALLALERDCGLRQGDARQLLEAIVRLADNSGSYRTVDRTQRFQDPGFFTGLAGLAYTMLRIEEPETLPCVLRWQ